MKKITLAILCLSAYLSVFSCSDDDSLKVPSQVKIQNFIWKGLNLYYLWQADSPDLSDDRFANQSELNNFLGAFQPGPLFEHLLIDRNTDRFSVLYPDYRLLEGVLSGTTKNNGMDFGLRYKPGSSTEIFGWVRYILPNSNAAQTSIQRGDIFYAINGTSLNISNYQNLLNQDSYTLHLATYDNGNITPTGETVTLTKTVLSENPIYDHRVIEVANRKVGYLMYNGFYAQYDQALNAVFGDFVAAGVNELILDLRYNSGGSVQTSTYLASMITGQFTGQVFSKEQWNEKMMGYFEETNLGTVTNSFTQFIGNNPIHHLNLNRIYILTSASTASASELVINGLKPYINVIQIGDVTTGKNVGSVTLYDSENFSREAADPNHYYAMQPIVLKIVNKDGFGDYTSGLEPNFLYRENMGNLGQIGDPSEPLLQLALSQITGSGRLNLEEGIQTRQVQDSKSLDGLRNQLYTKLPQ